MKMMTPHFVDVDCGTVEFYPTGRTGKDVQEIEIQTDDLYIDEQECQSYTVEHKECQTEERAGRGGGGGDEDGGGRPSLRDAPLPPDALAFAARVLGAMEEAVLENLEEDLFQGYDPRALAAGEGAEDAELRYSLSHDFAPHFASAGVEAKGGGGGGARLDCTGVAWTATGGSAVACFGRHDLTGWCDLPGLVCAWNLFRRGFDPARPDFVYEHSSCLMAVACHPEAPALVAAGSFNGEVVVLDMASDDQVVAVTGINDYFHREPVCAVRWTWDPARGEWLVASASADGNVLFWSLAAGLRYPARGYQVNAEEEAGGAGRGGGGGGRARRRRRDGPAEVLGVTALGFSRSAGGGGGDDDDGPAAAARTAHGSVVLGTEGGAVCRFFLRRQPNDRVDYSDSTVKWDKEAQSIISKVAPGDRPALRAHVERHCRERGLRQVTPSAIFEAKPDPALLFVHKKDFVYEGHAGPVAAVDCSPFHRNLALTAGADGLARVYTLLQAAPLLEVEPDGAYQFAAAWSRHRPQLRLHFGTPHSWLYFTQGSLTKVFAVGSGRGAVSVYDLGRSAHAPALVLEPPADPAAAQGAGAHHRGGGPGGGGRRPVYALAFNPKQRGFFAAGDGEGRVHVWQLGHRLSTPRPGERAALHAAFFLAEEGGDDGDDGGGGGEGDAGRGGGGEGKQ